MLFMNIYKSKRAYLMLVKIPFFFIAMIPSLNTLAQKGGKEKEVISITSTFKPSIVRTGKIEFYADPLSRDTSTYQFQYPEMDIPFSTNLTSFVIRPLVYKPQDFADSTHHFQAKLGYGNYMTPYASLAYQSGGNAKWITIGADHISSKGKLSNQQFARNKFSLGLGKKISEFQSVRIQAGYDGQAYRLYGYDQTLYGFSRADLLQNFNKYKLGAEYAFVTGREDFNATFTPSLRMDYLAAARNTREISLDLIMPFSFYKNRFLSFSLSPRYQFTSLNRLGNDNSSASLFLLPIKGKYTRNKFSVSAGLVPAFTGDKKFLLPDLTIAQILGEKGTQIYAGIDNRFNLNAYGNLYQINPYLLPPDSITIGRKNDYHIGASHQSKRGLQLGLKISWLNLKDQVLFVNFGSSGKDFKSLVESSLSAIAAETKFNYPLNSKLLLGADLKYYSFRKQEKYSAVYGWNPLESTLRADWKPLSGLTVRLRINAWSGSAAQQKSGANFTMKGAFDMNLGADYQLNKSWAIWIDLNNIANNPYQRWNQYQVIGFNTIAGIRYLFL